MIRILQIYYNLKGPLLYMLSLIGQNVVRQCIIYCFTCSDLLLVIVANLLLCLIYKIKLYHRYVCIEGKKKPHVNIGFCTVCSFRHLLGGVLSSMIMGDCCVVLISLLKSYVKYNETTLYKCTAISIIIFKRHCLIPIIYTFYLVGTW